MPRQLVQDPHIALIDLEPEEVQTYMAFVGVSVCLVPYIPENPNGVVSLHTFLHILVGSTHASLRSRTPMEVQLCGTLISDLDCQNPLWFII